METGLFAIMLVLGFAFTFFAFREGVGKMGGMLHMIGFVFFIGLSFFSAQGYEVSTTSTNLTYNNTGYLLFNETKTDVFLAGGTASYWLSYVYGGFATMNLMMLIRDIYTL